MRKKSSQITVLFLTALMSMFLLTSCDVIYDVNGSFEESIESGRLNTTLSDENNRRYFRFHLRQFEDSIGGTFESFDMSSYDTFRQVPLLMSNTTYFYYCARIDYGYVRSNTVYVVFTDREQRQWLFKAELGKEKLSGQLSRNQYYGNIELEGSEYLLPEDAAYITNHQDRREQLILTKMEKQSDKSLNCAYYFRKTEADIILPSDINYHRCMPSAQECRSLKLAVIGSPATRRIEQTAHNFQEIQTAYLDDCDISSANMRHIILRDNPFISSSILEGDLYLATVIIYEDIDLNGSWNKNTEPILATLDNQTLVFYSSVPESVIYGKNANGISQELPVMDISNLDEKGGWFLFNDSSEINGMMRMVTRLSNESSDRLYLKSINSAAEDYGKQRGCYINPTSDDQTACAGVLPILLY